MSKHVTLKQKYNKIIPGSDNDPCVYCNGPAYTIDHIVPRSLGGLNRIENYAPMCRQCNNNKSSQSVLLALFHPKIRRCMKQNHAVLKNKYQPKRNKQIPQE